MQDKLKPGVLAGVACGAASAIPPISCLNICCCALVIGGGFLAVFLYMKDAPPAAQAPYGDGAVLGLIAGVVAAFTALVISIPINLIFAGLGFSPDISQLQDAFDQAEIPPEVADMISKFIAGGGMTIGAMFIGLLFNLVVYSIFATLGGVIGAAVLHKKQVGSAGGAAPPPPPTAY